MKDGLKQRIVGTLVLAVVVVVLLPALLDFDEQATMDKRTQIPPPPNIDPVQIDEPVRPSGIEPPKTPDEMYQMNEQREEIATDNVVQNDAQPEAPGLTPEGIPRAWVIQVGSFRESNRAHLMLDQLLRDGHKAYIRSGQKDGAEMYRVYVGPKIDKNEALTERRQIEKQYQVKTLLLNFEP